MRVSTIVTTILIIFSANYRMNMKEIGRKKEKEEE